MFASLFSHDPAPAQQVETAQQALDRLVGDLNTVIDMMPEKPAVTVHPVTGHIALYPQKPSQ